MNKTRKTLLFLNLRFAEFYTKHLFKAVKDNFPVRMAAVVDQQFSHRVNQHMAPFLDHIYQLPSDPKLGFLGEFDYEKLRSIVKQELACCDELRLICTDEFNLLNAGKLRDEFNLQGTPEKSLLPFRDKVLMKKLLQKEGLRVPKFRKLTTDENFSCLEKELGLPFIMKPVDSCGSHGVYLIRTETDFDQIKSNLNNEMKHFEVEEYIEGVLYHVDSYIKNNECMFICANEYTCPNNEYTNGKALGSIPLDESNPLNSRLIHFAKKCLSVLGANNMVNHMELFLTQQDEIIFLEVSARPPGALLNLTHQINFGINLMDEDFFMQSGLTLNLPQNKTNEQSFWVLFPLLPGKIVKLQTPVLQSRCEMTWFVAKDDIIDPDQCKNIVGKSAHAVVFNEDKTILKNDFELIKNYQVIQVI